ncbi:multidrug transporter MatE [Moorella thermoacetica]|uniref:Antitoxin MazE n=2 Tax=Neomoorella thermoacetica TaxID=1525 RepID=A0AAC9MUH2_NEOTH|nr:AbrB/MazE/SpoVT family DNA-binding domain-containing protein [Moorella thermoacetica]AKX93781.1 antitoxin MazE [Moorella thermoacetica]AKX96423.1 antitoxin MazE [Moorella thermoacetica]AOQ23700.1 Antitoxin MazE [Moorella thermoacetica]APC08141.1 antitoxin MazE [Moorella thermoacetica]OIQ57593.1 antitoxin MazE [Moorella thermoacetica]
MQPHVQKWGNSLGIRIPLSLAQKIGLREGTPVDLQVDEDAIIIRRKQYSLEQMLARVKPENIHSEIDTGPQVGREIW